MALTNIELSLLRLGRVCRCGRPAEHDGPCRKERPQIECEVCGKKVFIRLHQQKHGWGRFCSLRCKSVGIQNDLRKKKLAAWPVTFWTKVKVGTETECWPWRGSINSNGYGTHTSLDIPRRIEKAHRTAYSLTHGGIPAGKIICHHCDNRPCCNPSHLYAGTHKDNTADAINRNRHNAARGEKHWNAKLSKEQAIKILADPRKYQEIAVEYNVKESTIGMLKSRHTWRRL